MNRNHSIYFLYLFSEKRWYVGYVVLRMPKKKYLQIHTLSLLSLCFGMVFFVNFLSVLFSLSIAEPDQLKIVHSLKDYILGNLQMENPVLFGVVWSLHKAFVGVLICLLGQIIAYYVDNLFVALIAPYIYVVVENFVTGILGIPQYSLLLLPLF